MVEKLRFSKIFFQTNTCKISGKTHFFVSIPVKVRSNKFFSYHYLYKKRSKYFLITPSVAPPFRKLPHLPSLWAALEFSDITSSLKLGYYYFSSVCSFTGRLWWFCSRRQRRCGHARSKLETTAMGNEQNA